VGGITVLKELRRRYPSADYVYLGDTANVPYGTKSEHQIRRLSLAAVSELKSRGIEALVVACNTASSLALKQIREEMLGTPVLGVVKPGATAAFEASRAQGARRILVLATRATVQSGAYAQALQKLAPDLEVAEQACPLLVPMIEEGWLDHPLLHATLVEYVGAHRGRTGVALLGCTHYPWIQPAVEKALPGWKVINSAEAVADAFAKELGSPGGRGTGRIEWIFTDPAAVPGYAQQWVDKATRLA
jgi:glutamate racemase